MTIFFDADSSTYEHGHHRAPLRVEVLVDGVLQLQSNDPEKRTFQIARIPEGTHEVEVVPYVGDAPAESRRERVRITSGDENRYKIVLHRSDGVSKISKFKVDD